MSCGNNLKQIGLANHNYHDIYKAFPSLRLRNRRCPGSNSNTQAWNTTNISWHGRILPFMEHFGIVQKAIRQLLARREVVKR